MTVSYENQIASLSNPTSQTAFKLSSTNAGYPVIAVQSDTIYRLSISGKATFDSTTSSGQTASFSIVLGDPTSFGSDIGLEIVAFTVPSSSPYYTLFYLDFLLFIDARTNTVYLTPYMSQPSSSWPYNNGSPYATSASLGSVLPNVFLTAWFSQSKSGNQISVNKFQIEEIF